MLEASVFDALDEDWEHRTTVGWFLALPFVASIAIGVAIDPTLAVPIGVLGVLLLVGYGRRILLASVGEPSLPSPGDVVPLVQSAAVGASVVTLLVVIPGGSVVAALWAEASPFSPAVSELIAATIAAVVLAAGLYLTPATLAVSGRSRPRVDADSTDHTDARRRLPQSSAPGHRVSARVSAMATIASSRDYVVATLQAILFAFTAGATTLMLLVTVFGLVLVPAVVFLATVVATRRYAYAVDRALDPAVVESIDDRTVSWL
ncbi:hypothetical protein [Halovivax cerinus]|uniref:Uncharacterized protein n=1 Tax=Halovivax cerinus TaxID=1487865 RepID=A0ABD5NII8_9EURY|nr:hypothetical protein [Halovivax cerinus]